MEKETGWAGFSRAGSAGNSSEAWVGAGVTGTLTVLEILVDEAQIGSWYWPTPVHKAPESDWFIFKPNKITSFLEVMNGQLGTLRSNVSNPHNHYCSILLPGFPHPTPIVILVGLVVLGLNSGDIGTQPSGASHNLLQCGAIALQQHLLYIEYITIFVQRAIISAHMC